MNISALHLTDGYKVDHRRQYPANTVKVYSNFTPRKSRVPGVDSIVFFGLTYFIKDVLMGEFKKTFFDLDVETVVKNYERRINNYLGPKHGITFDHIRALHAIGYLPVTIKALPEGALVKTNVPVLTITNELAEFFWVPNFLETILSCELWPGCTSLTTAFNYRLIFDDFALKTVGNTDFSSTFQIHDFSFRGMFGRHAAFLSGAAHLCASAGTDTIPAIDFLEALYNANSDKELVGGSVAATEHSVMCMGLKESELETFKRLILEIYPSGIISAVADTWDFFGVVRPVTGIAAQLKQWILDRDGKLVFRPDSGDPVKIITGYKIFDIDAFATLELACNALHQLEEQPEAYKFGDKYYRKGYFGVLESNPPIYSFTAGQEMSEAEAKGAIWCLYTEFGGTVNAKGFIELNPKVGLIYGDSITLERARQICQRLMDNGYASTNWVAGVGSYSYQYVTRDTYGFAMKATYGEIGHQVSKLSVKDGHISFVTDDGYHDSDVDSEDIDLLFDQEENVFNEAGDLVEGENILKNPFYVIEPREIFKDPLTDRDPVTGESIKKSAKGLLRVDLVDGVYQLTDQVSDEEEALGALEVVYQYGELVRDARLSDIRALVNQNIKTVLKVN